MINFESFTLANGLQVIVHEDHTSPMAVLNIIYNVGSRDENPDKTGFAHLFEHLMFGGSQNIPLFDEPLQKVGGENNAFTSPDITNYYLTVPAENLETGFWLESDRMLGLSFDPHVLEVQRKVVIEEFKQRYLNQPYGDIWLKLRPLIYQQHPYGWATIGKEISHIEDATMEDVKAFFYKFYVPQNAVMVVAGHVTVAQVKELSEKWFGPIPAGEKYNRNLPEEPKQTEARHLEIEANVPLDALYKVYHMCARTDDDFFTTDLLCDILGRGESSRFHEKLVKGKKLFNNINCYVMSSFEPGILVIEGKLNEGISIEEAEAAVQILVDEVKNEQVSVNELTKVKNQAESGQVFGEVELLNRAMALAFAANLGDTNSVNTEIEKVRLVTAADIQRVANAVLKAENCTTLYYLSKKA